VAGKTAVGFLRTDALPASHTTVQITVYKFNYYWHIKTYLIAVQELTRLYGIKIEDTL
jgi:hypothetical protein